MLNRICKLLRRYPITAFLLIQALLLGATLLNTAVAGTASQGFLQATAMAKVAVLLAAMVACSGERAAAKAREQR